MFKRSIDFMSSQCSNLRGVTQKYRKRKNLYFCVPLVSAILSLSLPSGMNNEYIFGSLTGVSCAALLYRFRWVAELMHRKPTYIESATTFKTSVYRTHAETFDEQMVHEIDTALSRRFRSVFIHVIICIDSVCVGILGYWAYIHMEGRDPDHWVKNLGFFGGYLMFFKQVHYYSGKLVLWLLKKKKREAHSVEVQRRRSSSDSQPMPSPVLAAINSQRGKGIPVVRSMDNFSLCGQEIVHNPLTCGSMPDLELEPAREAVV